MNMRMCSLMLVLSVATDAIGGEVMTSARSEAFSIDTIMVTNSTYTVDGSMLPFRLDYSSSVWNDVGGHFGTARIVVNDEKVFEEAGEGTFLWSPSRAGVYRIQHIAANGITWSKRFDFVAPTVSIARTGYNLCRLTASDGVSEIRYTMDGTMPTAESELYIKPFEVPIDRISFVRASTFAVGYPQGEVASAVFNPVPSPVSVAQAKCAIDNSERKVVGYDEIMLSYDTAWEGDADSSIELRVDGALLGKRTGFGDIAWVPNRAGSVIMTLRTVSAAGDVLAEYLAQYDVVPREITISDNAMPLNERYPGACQWITNITVAVGVTSLDAGYFDGCVGLEMVTMPARFMSQFGNELNGCPITYVVAVTFDANGGESGCSLTQKYGTMISAPTVTRTGYIFNGWSPEITATVLEDDVTFVAQWQPCTHTGPKLITKAGQVATCMEDGWTREVRCSCCGAILSAGGEVIPAPGHQLDGGVVTKAPTMDECGVRTFSCTRCGEFVKAESIPKLGLPPNFTIDGNGRLVAVDLRDATEVHIPDGVTSIDGQVFQNCDRLVSVTIPNGVTNIGEKAFYRCSNLVSVIMPNSVIAFGADIFAGCCSITNATLPEAVFSSDVSLKTEPLNHDWSSPRIHGVWTDINMDSRKWGYRCTFGDTASVTFPVKGPLCLSYRVAYHSNFLANHNVSVSIDDNLVARHLVGEKGWNEYQHCPENKYWSEFGECRVPVGNHDITFIYHHTGGTATSQTGNAYLYIEMMHTISSLFPDSYDKISNVSILGNPSVPCGFFNGCNRSVYDTTSIPGVNLVDGWVVEYNGDLPRNLDLMCARGVSPGAFWGCDSIESIKMPSSFVAGESGFCVAEVTATDELSVSESQIEYSTNCVTTSAEMIYAEAVEDNVLYAYGAYMYFKGGVTYYFSSDYGRNSSIIIDGSIVGESVCFAESGFRWIELRRLSSGGILNSAGGMWWWTSYDSTLRKFEDPGDGSLFRTDVEMLRTMFPESFENMVSLDLVDNKPAILNEFGKNAESRLFRTVNGTGRLWYTWKASSEYDEIDDAVYDYGFISVDGEPLGYLDGDFKLQGHAIGGSTDWISDYVDIYGDGEHIVSWTYLKDDTDEIDGFDDRIWIADVKWTPLRSLSFDLGGGKGETPGQIMGFSDSVVILPTDVGFGRDGYAFAGWSDGINTYVGGAELAIPYADVTLVAQWIRKAIISFNLYGGMGDDPAEIIDVPGAVVSLPSSVGIVKANHTFAGWDDGRYLYAAGANYTIMPEDVIISAHWTANTISCPTIDSAQVMNGGVVSNEVFVVLAISADAGTTLHYTLDGTTPTAASPVYGGPLVLTGYDVTVKAIAVRDNYFDSEVTEFSFTRLPYTLAECLGLGGMDGVSVSVGGNGAEWHRVFGGEAHDGVAGLRSGAITHSQTNWVEVTVDGPGTLSFWWNASSESVKGKVRDGATFFVDGKQSGGMIGGTNLVWSQVSQVVDGAGSHVFRWIYGKSASDASAAATGEDCAWLDEVVWSPLPRTPAVVDDPSAVVTGDAESGFVVKPSAANGAVEVTIPGGVDAAKVTVEVAPTIESVKANGANVRVKAGAHDITQWLDIPQANANGVIDMTKADVKQAVADEAMDTSKGAEVNFGDTTEPFLKTSATKPGLTYTLREGVTLRTMSDGATKQGDGEPWTPQIKVKNGASGFYTIKVGK